MTRQQNVDQLAESERPRVIASFVSYEGMLEALRTRVSELQISGSGSTTLPACRAAICRN